MHDLSQPPDLTILHREIQKFTGKKLTDVQVQILIHLQKVEEANLEQLTSQTASTPATILAACRLLNESNLCWWNETVPRHYYLTAQGRCMLTQIQYQARSRSAQIR
ncbi:hypothetical protein ACQ4M3_20690 [Leptolyngbya sp. AN03gr2]|uniref:hypothetical protein n=1 Tax=unclassified Leptolyngbya TaxID=2650499 RepID=UPI003D31F1DA